MKIHAESPPRGQVVLSRATALGLLALSGVFVNAAMLAAAVSINIAGISAAFLVPIALLVPWLLSARALGVAFLLALVVGAIAVIWWTQSLVNSDAGFHGVIHLGIAASLWSAACAAGGVVSSRSPRGTKGRSP